MLLWIYCFRLFFIRTFVCLSISWSTAWNLGSFKVYSLFSYQCTSSILRIDFRSCFATSERIFQSHSSLSSLGDSLFTISYHQPFVNNFFIFFYFFFRSALPVRCSRGQLVYIIIIILECQPHFRRFKKESFRFWIVLIVHTIQNHSFSLPADYRIT